MHTCPHCQRTLADAVDTLKDNWMLYACPCGATWQADGENTKAYGLETPPCNAVHMTDPTLPISELPRCTETPVFYSATLDHSYCIAHTPTNA